MKTKFTFLIVITAVMATSFGCKKSNCCTLAEDNNIIVASKNNSQWRATGYLYKFNQRTDTAYLQGSKDQENLNILIKKSGNSYIMIEATVYEAIGDMIMGDYVLDTSKNNTFSTTNVTDDMVEGKFELYFKINHSDPPGKYPATLVFKSGLFRVRWDNVPKVVLP